MNGELAEAVALVAHGNAWLANVGPVRQEMASFEARNTTFQYVRSVRFEVKSRWRPASEVGSVAAWLTSISRAGVRSLSLIAGGSKPVAFANEGSWAIVGHSRRSADAWYGHWEVNRSGVEPAELKPRIWEVSYRRVHTNQSVEVDRAGLASRVEDLRNALIDARDFAERDPALTTFIPWFDEALTLESTQEPDFVWHPDMLPKEGYPLNAHRALAMATRSWVFGGMGSWNDVGFYDVDTQAHYRRVSERLYQAVLGAIREATNSYETRS